MREKFEQIFNLFKHLKSMQTIVNEINTLDYYVYNFDEEKSIDLIDFCLTKFLKSMAYTMICYSNTFKNPNGDTIVEGRFEKNVDGNVETLTRVEFDVWMEDANGEHGNYIGKVIGVPLPDGSDMRYNFPDCTRRQANLIWDQIDEIEQHYFVAPSSSSN